MTSPWLTATPAVNVSTALRTLALFILLLECLVPSAKKDRPQHPVCATRSAEMRPAPRSQDMPLLFGLGWPVVPSRWGRDACPRVARARVLLALSTASRRSSSGRSNVPRENAGAERGAAQRTIQAIRSARRTCCGTWSSMRRGRAAIRLTARTCRVVSPPERLSRRRVRTSAARSSRISVAFGKMACPFLEGRGAGQTGAEIVEVA